VGSSTIFLAIVNAAGGGEGRSGSKGQRPPKNTPWPDAGAQSLHPLLPITVSCVLMVGGFPHALNILMRTSSRGTRAPHACLNLGVLLPQPRSMAYDGIAA
jgi:hypothetical protein